ncbi:hypothetical protein FA95DRAFT_1603654 [Auriscalpium vulgare]|uniref:Uncharacterized protein n=1 Tax=Auriscalpium vulgare TaxID=40419 RepID=A0ACB8S1S1_9AGAM|nr:hypothetical protein FA95DRAFT_1603654 [Auriscalpium vulgare]
MASATTQAAAASADVPPAYGAAGTTAISEAGTSTTATSSNRPGFPGVYRIGTANLQVPLVKVKHLQCHLNLLGAFAQLRQEVEASDAALPEAAMRLETERRWAWFVGLAVERFERWVKNINLAPTNPKEFAHAAAPPLDVWLVWHAYMLNPESFADDCSRHKSLLPLSALLGTSDSFFLEVLEELGDMNKLTPSEARIASWLSETDTPYDPLEAARVLTHQSLQCPVCEKAVQARYLESDGTGYAQQKFTVTCPACAFVITRDKLAIFRFTSDLALDLDSQKIRDEYGLGVYLPATLRSSVLPEQKATARVVKEQLLTVAPFKPSGHILKRGPMKSALEMAQNVGWDWSTVKTAVQLKVRARTGARVFGCYHDQRPFSVELVGAVLRQGSFVKKMKDLHWTEADYFENPDDELALHHANVRYHAFLDLMSSSPSSFLVPTLDIDLAWHTHQLTGPRYQANCKAYVKRYVNHDDKVEETHLANAFDLTCRAWFDRFKVQYMQCGCPLPGDTIGQKLSRLVSHAGSRYYPQAALAPPPELPELLAASHPSDHNSVAVPDLPHYKANHQAYEKKMQRRRERVLAARRRDGVASKEQFDHGGFGFAPAFLVPVPLYWGGMGGIGGCVAGAGNVVDAGAGGWGGGFSGCSAVSVYL